MSSTMYGDGFRAARERLGLSQKRLAALLGLTNTTICRYETGSRPIDARSAAVLLALQSPGEMERLAQVALRAEERDEVAARLRRAFTCLPPGPHRDRAEEQLRKWLRDGAPEVIELPTKGKPHVR